MRPSLFTDQVLVMLGPWPLTRTMLSSLAVTLALALLAALLARSVRRRPEGRAAATGRIAYGFLHDLVTQAAGRPWPGLEVFAGTLFLFIAAAAVLGQLPEVPAPTADLPAAAALATLVFAAVPVAGVRARGLGGYLRHYLRPTPILFPLHVISELSRTVALALRLFGNMMSGHLVVALIVALVGVLVPVPLMALDLLIGLLQAYIFTILTAVYIGAAARVGEQS
jgi:F-type H+-transporting ATPase subunit a